MLSGFGVRFDGTTVAIWLAPAFAGVLALVFTSGARIATRRRVQRFNQLLIFGYLAAVVAITLYPYHVDLQTGRILSHGNWVPFGGTLGFLLSNNSLKVHVGSRDFFANVVLFAPLGLLLGVQQRRTRGLVLVVVALALLAFVLEVVQGLTIAERTLDIDDAIAGAFGALVAVCVAAIVRPATRPTTRAR